MQGWKMFDLKWLRVFPEHAEIREGSTVAIIAKHLEFYSINLSRIVYVCDSEGPLGTFGFAYGTLLEHAETGEERFEIVAFSMPRAPLARIGYPISRILQRRFGRKSLAAMKRAVR